MKEEFVIKLPIFILLIILFIGIFFDSSAVIWILFGYCLGCRIWENNKISEIGNNIVNHVKESKETYKNDSGIMTKVE